jgi:hypothetical protein
MRTGKTGHSSNIKASLLGTTLPAFCLHLLLLVCLVCRLLISPSILSGYKGSAGQARNNSDTNGIHTSFSFPFLSFLASSTHLWRFWACFCPLAFSWHQPMSPECPFRVPCSQLFAPFSIPRFRATSPLPSDPTSLTSTLADSIRLISTLLAAWVTLFLRACTRHGTERASLSTWNHGMTIFCF